jgi:predicted nucleic acid-binding protein
MNVVDSSAWLEYFANGPNADYFAAAVEDVSRLVVPSICILEVFRRVYQQRGEALALQAVALMQQGQMQELDAPLALTAGRLGLAHGLPLADSVVLATARQHGARLWTQDADFKGLEGVRYIPRRKPR